MAKGKARKYYVVEQVQDGLWHQVGHFATKYAAAQFRGTLDGRTQIIHTWPSYDVPARRYALKDASNRVVARSKSKAAAHRVSRKKKHTGTRVVTTTKTTTVERRTLNRAKLSARGRTELVRVSREKETPEDTLTNWEKTTVTLMSDGSVMEKRDVRFKPSPSDPRESDPYAAIGSFTLKGRFHSYGWKVKGKAKAGLTPRQFADIYAGKGFEVESVSSLSGDVAVRTEKAVEKSKKARAKRAEKVKAVRAKEAAMSGPGFYVTNSTTGGMLRAAEIGPFASLDEATSAAWDRLREFMDMKFTYLLPVQVIESSSREAAEMGDGHVWWVNGKMRGAPVPESQLALAV